MKEELKILKEILDITKLSGIQDPNGKIMSPFDSDNTQEKISLFNITAIFKSNRRYLVVYFSFLFFQ